MRIHSLIRDAKAGVVGQLCVAIRSSMDNGTTVQYCGLIQQLTSKARSAVRDLDPSNDLTFLRIRSKKNEIMRTNDLSSVMVIKFLLQFLQLLNIPLMRRFRLLSHVCPFG
ncbi:unnamed protein product [Echinostoma caproni]|uniref:Robl_LC7 domain-containing protein n=1 Tax=Echinostoma caproni TaxID=27848 RepID=A0A183AWL8_9TREM|nr:unnamed protein product [Echinostoma caproni]